ncbi:hypothetical protein SCP_0200720 [Sparassis crispa]|uniref:WWE domain-containing protein n=1 Tax=Sparassis crispa TaxID=139825 RepID=A0A401G9N0_9APHY|nr:hypothetical protein SCP_0200720 [Sparassis crispa]GBE78875.1 hypothetical protein SCP_0200720 [Sparassis crispa]
MRLKRWRARAARCVKFAELVQGPLAYTKFFLLQFNNDFEAVLCIPCLAAGLTHLSVSSEVATMRFAREELGIPVPRVLAWSSKENATDNILGTPYVLTEKVPGIEATLRRKEMDDALLTALPLICGLHDCEEKMGRYRFSQIGSLCFTEDHALPQTLGRYSIGPLADRMWWRGNRATMDLDRGPWPDMAAFMQASARNEQAWIRQHASPDDRRFCSILQSRDPAEHLRALDMYAEAAPFIVPGPQLCEPTLWCSDSSLSNIRVAPFGTLQITGVPDWQGAYAAPFCVQEKFPDGFRCTKGTIEMPTHPNPPQIPSDFESLDEHRKNVLSMQRALANLKEHYWSFHVDNYLWLAQAIPHLEPLNTLHLAGQRCWSDSYMKLVLALLDIRNGWNKIAPRTPCPITFSEDEEREFNAVMDSVRVYWNTLKELDDALRASPEGWVSNEDYPRAKRLLEEAKWQWDENEMGGWFPYQDGMHSFSLC